MNVNDQRNDMAKFTSLIGAGDAAIAALDPNLRDEAIAARRAEIRKDFEAKTDLVMGEMGKRRSEALAALPKFTQEAARRRAKFSDDDSKDAMIRLAKLAMLERTPTSELLPHLDDAVDSNNLALAELVRLEFSKRDDRNADPLISRQFQTKLDRIVDETALARHAELREIIQIPEVAVVALREFSTGRADPIGRLSASRVSSLGKPPAPEPRDAEQFAEPLNRLRAAG